MRSRTPVERPPTLPIRARTSAVTPPRRDRRRALIRRTDRPARVCDPPGIPTRRGRSRVGGMNAVPGQGLVKGLAVTLKTMVSPSHTHQYPDVEPDLPPRSRGVI